MLDRLLSGSRNAARYITWLGLNSIRPPRTTPLLEELHHRTDPLKNRIDENIWRTRAPAMIEPNWGYLLGEPWQLETSGFDTLKEGVPTWRYGTPDPLEWRRRRDGRRGRVTEVGEVISIRNLYEWNYYHFAFDVLSMLALLDEFSLIGDREIVVGPFVEDMAFPPQLMRSGWFGSLNWRVQHDDEYLRAERVILARPQLSYRRRAEFLTAATGADEVEGDEERRVFLTRRPPATRVITNGAEVERALAARGFEPVDTAPMTVADQIALFRQTRHVVAVHGAGMTNIAYRAGRRMSVVELTTRPHRYASDFTSLAYDLDYDFRRLSFPVTPGSPADAPDIIVDVDELARTVDELLEDDRPARSRR